ncbi:MAG: glycosyltransferase family 4 protein [Candidatus Binatus sp.]|uniref:glycosyltransferase family 4 protein n=1 Tax=Candidatus Binatus sp. TaxID=2811406 RepID=UPI0027195504|nr:glycosyltransferase family 4 protein [Candidatus Binatus sp.]MDO8434031.1 glycosyltransferase family 4 protein [Candidatus Binatus sp.]
MNHSHQTSGAVNHLPRLRIAQIAPLYEPTPPKLYGGTERVVSHITEELVRRGHEVTLFASGDSVTRANLEPGCPRALRLAGISEAGLPLHLSMLSDAYTHAAQRFDIIHSHLDYWSFPLAEMSEIPSVATLHCCLDAEELRPVYARYRNHPVVSISDSQRRPLPFMNWVATVHHGLPRDLLKFNATPRGYLAFLGRMSREKRPDLAIAIALRAGIPLMIAAKIDLTEQGYFDHEIKPLMNSDLIEYVGEINDSQKADFLGNAIALLFPIDWPEPFGLTMIEALACGTPVIARPCGSVPEVIEHGLTGFVAESVDELAAAVTRVDELSRENCRAEFERRFTVETMVDRYEHVYRELISRRDLKASRVQ